MIILSGVLVVAAIALLVAGIVAGNGDSAQVFGLDALVVIYISIAVSIVSALCLAIGVFLRRKELFGAGAPSSAGKKKSPKRKRPASPVPAQNTTPARGAMPAPPVAKPPTESADDEVEIPAPSADVPEDAVVFVVRGRKRYHLDTCRQLAGRDTEELTYAEAKEEGFSPCTACMPDTALAARAAVSPTTPKTGAGKAEPPKPGGDRPAPSRPEKRLAGMSQPASQPETQSASQPGGRSMASSTPPPSLDKTAEISRAEPAAAAPSRAPEAPSDPLTDSSWPVPEPATAESARRPPEPTVTDLPGAQRREDALSAPLAAVPAEPEPETPSAPERPAETASVTREAAAEAEDPLNVRDTAAPRPRDADEAGEAVQIAGSAAAEPAAESSEDEGPQVRILSGTRRYHRTDCALIEDIGDEAEDLEALSRAEAKARGCTPCLVCQPDREHARD
ncbi:hypothetical protein [Actinomadura macra]|uniref:hypothetical protein n=1 Tax=Actinomadura macra TaxID=46164 RepID=UPI00082F28B4|nr:hypothetical protein [Actinomadura macra]